MSVKKEFRGQNEFHLKQIVSLATGLLIPGVDSAPLIEFLIGEKINTNKIDSQIALAQSKLRAALPWVTDITPPTKVLESMLCAPELQERRVQDFVYGLVIDAYVAGLQTGARRKSWFSLDEQKRQLMDLSPSRS